MGSGRATMDVEFPQPHGQKRVADDDLEGEQRLSKRFTFLNIEHTGRLYIPIQVPRAQPPQIRRTRSNAISDSMQVDESKDRIYIQNLDEELADIESEEERLVFLPDIEKQLAKIPQSVLQGKEEENKANQVVLYDVPKSLTVPTEHDSVRRAIIESRQRAREKQLEVVRKDLSGATQGTAGVLGLSPRFKPTGVNGSIDIDDDIMDIS